MVQASELTELASVMESMSFFFFFAPPSDIPEIKKH